MPKLGPLCRAALITYLKQSGFDGPYAGGNHEYMKKGSRRLPIPNPHQGDIERNLLAVILRNAGISREEWEKL